MSVAPSSRLGRTVFEIENMGMALAMVRYCGQLEADTALKAMIATESADTRRYEGHLQYS